MISAESVVLLITWVMCLFLAEYIFLEHCVINCYDLDVLDIPATFKSSMVQNP